MVGVHRCPLHNFYDLAYQYASSAPKEEEDEDHSLGVIGDSGYNNYIDGGSTRINNAIFVVFDSSEEMIGPIYDGLLGIITRIKHHGDFVLVVGVCQYPAKRLTVGVLRYALISTP